MAGSIHFSITVGSRIHGIPGNKISAGAGSDKLRRSQFFGPGRLHIPCSSRMSQVAVVKNATRAGTIRSASFFEKLGQVFSSSDVDEEQIVAVYEINEQDRGSPVLLRLTPAKDAPVPSLGDLVPYTNKVYDASGKVYLGLSAGICVSIENSNGRPQGDRYETTYTHYLGGYGQLSAMGPYYTTSDSEMVVTGGTGIFKGARGIVKLHTVMPPIKILYTYYLTGIQKLPPALTGPVVPLPQEVPAKPAPVIAST